MNIEEFTRESKRLSEAEYSTLMEERKLVRELLSHSAIIGNRIIAKRKPADTDYSEIVEMYNRICGHKLPKVTKIQGTRKNLINGRIKEGYTKDDFQKLFNMVADSEFLSGGNERVWIANFDWILKSSNMIKILEGTYNKAKPQPYAPDDKAYSGGF